jgi:hypothetical protein
LVNNVVLPRAGGAFVAQMPLSAWRVKTGMLRSLRR